MMRSRCLVMWMLLWSVSSATADINIGISIPIYPEFERVPGYPVYYASQLDLNFFFYDGMYWVYEDDDWYVSSWYNGPWDFVDPWDVPLFVLRIPVRYYRYPPAYFHGWHHDAPPHWGEHWGREWERHRHGWDRWDHRSAPPLAPLPHYQERYSRDRYPHDENEQRAIHGQHYRYRPHEGIVRERYEGHHRSPDRDQGPAHHWDGNKDRDRAQGSDRDPGRDDRRSPSERTSREHDKPRTDVTEPQRPEGHLPRPAPIPDQREPAVDRGRLRQDQQGQEQPSQHERQRQQQKQEQQQNQKQEQQEQRQQQERRRQEQQQKQGQQQEQRQQQEQQRQEQRQQQEQQRQLKDQQLQLQRQDERQRQQEQRQQEQQQRQEQRQQQEQLQERQQQQELQRQRQDQQRWQKQQEQRQAPTTEQQAPRSTPDNIQKGEGASQAAGRRHGGPREK